MKKLNYIIGFFALAVAGYAIAASVLGRMELTYPDLDDPAGATQVTQQQDTIEALSDNMPARINEYTGIADSVTTTITHNFGLNSESLGLILYSGIGDSKIYSKISTSGFTIVDNAGDPKNKIDITTPVSGGPHDFSFVISWGGSSGSGSIGGNLTFAAPLFEDLSANTYVKVYDDGGTAKIRNVLEVVEASPDTPVLTTGFVNAISGPEIMVPAYNPSTGKYIIAAGEIFNLGSMVGTDFVVTDTFSSSVGNQSCVVYDSADDQFVIGYVSGGALNLSTVSVSGSTMTVALPSIIAAAPSELNCSLAYNSTNDRFLFAYRDSGNNVNVMAFTTGVGSISTGSTVVQDTSFAAGPSLIYNSDINRYVLLNFKSSCAISLWNDTTGSPVKVNEQITSGYSCRVSDVTYFPNENVFIATMYSNLSGGTQQLLPFSATDSLITLGTPTQLAATWDSRAVTTYNPALGTNTILEFGGVVSYRQFEISGLTVSLGTSYPIFHGAVNGSSFDSTMFYDPTIENNVGLVNFDGDSEIYDFAFSGGVYNFDYSQGIGILGEAGLSGEEGTVTLLGGVSSSFTGSPIGDTAYLQEDGTVSSTVPTFGIKFPIGKFLTPSDLFMDQTNSNLRRSQKKTLKSTITATGTHPLPDLAFNNLKAGQRYSLAFKYYVAMTLNTSATERNFTIKGYQSGINVFNIYHKAWTASTTTSTFFRSGVYDTFVSDGTELTFTVSIESATFYGHATFDYNAVTLTELSDEYETNEW